MILFLSRCRHYLLLLTLVGGICSSALPAGADAAVAITVVEPWAGVFGGSEATFHFTVTAPEAVRARAGWGFAIDNRVVSRGEAEIRPEPGQPEVVAVKIAVPPVKAGVIIPATLTITVAAEGGAPPAVLEKRLWIFPKDPFTDRTEWLKALDIHLYDPEGKTAERLEKAEVPFSLVGNIEALAEPGDNVVLIGEGLSFADYRALPEMIVQAAAAGHPVLCLAPTDGLLQIPGTGGVELPAPARISLRHNDIITELDKRLDAGAWPAGDNVAASLAIRCEDDLVSGEVVQGRTGWPWLELSYQHRLVFCGFGIIEGWDDGPTPRFLLARLLEYVTGGPASDTRP
jgi:hypothetical protein